MTSAAGIIITLVFACVGILVWIGSVVHCLRSRFRTSGDKVAWLLVLLLLPIVGTGLYLLLGRRSTLMRRPHRFRRPMHRSANKSVERTALTRE